MALEATHMRLALDVQEKYQVQDLQKYIVGTIYPDSRYVSGIDRTMTHSEEFLQPEFAKDDFHKGWQVHQLVDTVQTKIIKGYFSEMMPEFIKTGNFTSGEWEFFTAVKIVQDMEDMQKFDLQKCVEYLENYVFNPNGEDIEDVRKYNQIMIDLYKNKKKISIEDGCKMWKALGIDNGNRRRMKNQTEKILENKNMVDKINTIYDEMLLRVNKFLVKDKILN